MREHHDEDDGGDEDEDTHPERRRPRPATVTVVDDLAPVLALDLDAPVAVAQGSQPALDLADVGAAAPTRRHPFVAACSLGGKPIVVETDGVAVSLVLLKAMKIVATPAEALTLAKALLRAVALARR